MDPIEKWASLNDATLKAQAASMGLGDLYKSGDRNAKMQATLAAITAQSGNKAGQPNARESDTLQGQQQRMAAAFENTRPPWRGIVADSHTGGGETCRVRHLGAAEHLVAGAAYRCHSGGCGGYHHVERGR